MKELPFSTDEEKDTALKKLKMWTIGVAIDVSGEEGRLLHKGVQLHNCMVFLHE